MLAARIGAGLPWTLPANIREQYRRGSNLVLTIQQHLRAAVRKCMVALRSQASAALRGAAAQPQDTSSIARYWADHHVSLHYRCSSDADLVEYFSWLNGQCIRYFDLILVAVRPGMAILDFHCRHGHSLVGFSKRSAPRHLVGGDVSTSSLAVSRARVVQSRTVPA